MPLVPNYTPTDWVDNTTPVDEAHLDKIEVAVDAHADAINALDGRLTTEETKPTPPTVVNGKWLKGVSGAMVWSDITEADVANLTADLAAKVPLSSVTAKGDLLAATGNAALTRLAAGGVNTILTPDTGQSMGLKWGQIADAMIAAGQNLAKLAAVTGTPTGAKFLRDDGSWQAPPGGGSYWDTVATLPTQFDTGTTLVDITGLSIAVVGNSTYEVEFVAGNMSSSGAGLRHSIACSAAGATGEVIYMGTATGASLATGASVIGGNGPTMTSTASGTGVCFCKAYVRTYGSGGNITAMLQKITSGTASCLIGSALKVRKVV